MTQTVLGQTIPTASQQPAARESGTRGGTSSPAAGAQAILAQAVRQVESLRSINAKMLQSVELFGKRLAGTGTYLEQCMPEGVQLRLELNFQLDDRKSTFLQVCKGNFLWIGRDKQPPARIDLIRVTHALEEKGRGADPMKLGLGLGLGGLPKLLRGLDNAFEFTMVEETRLGDQLLVYRLQGEWKPEKLVELLPEQGDAIRSGKPADLDKLPSHLPHYVVLFLEKPGLFPRRIEYWRHPQQDPNDKSSREDQAIANLFLYEVLLNGPINPASFDFSPGDQEFSDQTDRYLETMGIKKPKKP